MKKILLAFAALFCVCFAWADGYTVDRIPNVQLGDSRRFVSNPDGVLSEQAVRRMDAVCASLRDRGYAQVAVVAVRQIEGEDLYSFAIELFEKWGVGGRESDNGLGILLVRDRREIRFVTGEGVEGVLPDAVCKRIQMKYMIPAFRQENYDKGMTDGLLAAAKLLEGGQVDLSKPRPARRGAPWWVIFVFMGGFVVVGLYNNYQKRRCPHCRRAGLRLDTSRDYLVNDVRITEQTYVCTHCGHTVLRRVRSSRDDDFHGGAGGPFIGGFGGFGGLGGFGGGGSFGGGFGGGSFGGGGAGSKW